jgi:hypothetical protein
MKKVLKNGRIFGIFHSVLTFPSVFSPQFPQSESVGTFS